MIYRLRFFFGFFGCEMTLLVRSMSSIISLSLSPSLSLSYLSLAMSVTAESMAGQQIKLAQADTGRCCCYRCRRRVQNVTREKAPAHPLKLTPPLLLVRNRKVRSTVTVTVETGRKKKKTSRLPLLAPPPPPPRKQP